MPRKPDVAATNPTARPDWSAANDPFPRPGAASPAAFVAPTYAALTFAAPTYVAQQTYPAQQPYPAQPAQWGSPVPTPRRFLGMTPLAAALSSIGLLVLVGGGWFAYGALTKDSNPGSDLAAATSLASPDSTSEPSNPASETPVVAPETEGLTTSPSGNFTFVIDPAWIYDAESVATAEVVPGETAVGAWWTEDLSLSPTATWFAISEYTLPGSTLDGVHQSAVDAFTTGMDITRRWSSPVTPQPGSPLQIDAVMTSLQATADGGALYAEIYSYEYNGYFLEVFSFGPDREHLIMNTDLFLATLNIVKP